MRLTKDQAPLLIAFGNKARSGKSESASAIVDSCSIASGFGPYDIMRTGFAAPLRTEIWNAIYGENALGDCTPEERVKDLCLMVGADYDPKPIIDAVYPYGKQRSLLQKWGSEFRRAENPFYWINALEQMIVERKPQIVIIDDLRFPNEFFWVHSLGGTVVKVDRPDYKSDIPQHISETALDGYEFDYTITSQEGQVDQLRADAVELFNTIVNRWSGAECASFFQTLGDAFAVQER
jgi:deoxynucleotide monophosphate kinase-like protein